MQWWNWDRGRQSGAIRAGQRTAIGLRVPPRCEARSFIPLYGVLPAQVPAGVVLVVDLRRAERVQAAELV